MLPGITCKVREESHKHSAEEAHPRVRAPRFHFRKADVGNGNGACQHRGCCLEESLWWFWVLVTLFLYLCASLTHVWFVPIHSSKIKVYYDDKNHVNFIFRKLQVHTNVNQFNTSVE